MGSLVQQHSTTGTQQTSSVETFSACVAGNIMIVVCVANQNSTVPPAVITINTPTTGGTWTPLGAYNAPITDATHGNVTHAIFGKVAAGGETSVTCSITNGASNRFQTWFGEFSGYTLTLDGAISTAGNGSLGLAGDTGTKTPSAGGRLWIGAVTAKNSPASGLTGSGAGSAATVSNESPGAPTSSQKETLGVWYDLNRSTAARQQPTWTTTTAAYGGMGLLLCPKTDITASATATGTSSLAKSVGLVRSATSTGTATFTKVLTRALTFASTATGTASLTKSVGLIRSATATCTASLLKSIAFTRSATATCTASFLKSIAMIRSASATGTATFTKSFTRALEILKTTTVTPSFIKSAGLNFTNTATGTASYIGSKTKNLTFLATSYLGVSVGSDYESEILVDSPDVYYRLDEASGDFIDRIGGNDLTPDGTIIPGASLLLSDADASVTFDYMSTLQYADSSYTIAQEPMTVEFWVEPNALSSASAGYSVVAACNNGANGWGCSYLDTTGQWRFTTWGVKDYDFAATAAIGVTQHVAFVVNSDHSVDLYIDGAFTEKVTHGAGMNATAGGLKIGYSHAATQYPQARLDELAIYASALSAGRISDHYTAGITIPSRAPIFLKSVGLVRSITSTVTPSSIKSIAKTFAQTCTGTPVRLLQTAKTFSGSITLTPIYIGGLAFLREFSTTVTGTPVFSKSIGLVRSATSSVTATISKVVGLIRSATATGTASSTSSIAKTFTATATGTATFVKSVALFFAKTASVTPSALLVSAVTIIVPILAAVTSSVTASFNKRIFKTFSVVTTTVPRFIRRTIDTFRDRLRRPVGNSTTNTLDDTELSKSPSGNIQNTLRRFKLRR